MKILGKLLVGFMAVALLCGVVGVVGLTQLSSLSNSLRSMSKESIPTLKYLNEINTELSNIKTAVRSVTNPYGADDPAFVKRQKDNIAGARERRDAAIKSFESISQVPEEAKLWANVKASMPSAAAYSDEIFSLVDKAVATTSPEEREALYRQIYVLISGERGSVFDDVQADVNKVLDFDTQYYGVELPANAMAAAQIGVTVVVTVTIVSFAVAILLGVLLGTSISRSLKSAVRVLDKIAQGDLSERFVSKTKDEFAQVSASIGSVAENIAALISEAGMLTQAAVEGRLSTRGDALKFKGGYHDIVAGVNKTLDAVIGPLNVAASYVDRIAAGDIPPKITDNYNGDFNLIKMNLNKAIDAVKLLVEDAGMLAQAAVEGRLSTRAEAAKHQGDYRKIVDGVNRTLDLVITPINETTAVLKRLAEGDLTQLMTGDYKGDFDILKTALNDSLESINDILGQVNIAVEQVAEGSQQVSQASQSLSQGATEQASSLEEITSSITEISGQTKQNTENAVQVNGLAKTARDEAEQGNVQMKDLVSAMSDINASAEEIKKIVKAIDDISFQINLLALNANVEAARAGKYGKGFAVVAEEVRNLAVRSANSVKDTTRMVDEAISNIDRGNKLVGVTAKQLASIVEGASKVAVLAEEVSTASKEQTQGLEQITMGLNQIDQVTQANTASAEESASAAEELSSQSQQVKTMLGRFRLRARESKLSNQDVMAMLKAELARQQHSGAKAAGPALAAPAHRPTGLAERKPAAGAAPKLNPADVIALDDDNFGKF